MGVLSVVLGFAALPCSAMAQTSDTTPPTINIATPADGAQYKVGDQVVASYSCTDADSAIAECAGTVANGAPLDTSSAGPRSFTVNARDAAGNTATLTRNYTIVAQGPVGGDTPATLTLSLGAPASFSPFIPGQSRDYLASTTAQILSTAENATLTVADASSDHTGHLVNGPYFLPAPIEVGAKRPDPATATTPAPVGGSSNPTTLLVYEGPVNESITLNFEQSIAVTDALRTGPYGKTLTFTLSTTSP
jgi:hypothetical protein